MRPPPRVPRGDDSKATPPGTSAAPPSVPSVPPSVLPTSDAEESKRDDISTRVTVPSAAPEKTDAAAEHERDVSKRETRPAPRDEVVERPHFDRKFITPLAMHRTTTPPRPVAAPSSEERPSERAHGEHHESAPAAVISELPEGATRPAISEESLASYEKLVASDRSRATREPWVTTGAVRVAVSREGSRVIVRPHDGGVLLDGEVEALLVATPDAERLFRLLKVEGSTRT